MSDQRPSIAWRGPATAWIVMLLGLAGAVCAGESATGALRFGAAMGGSALMLAALALGLVGLARASALLRLVATAGLAFIAVLFLLSFTDLLTRLR